RARRPRALGRCRCSALAEPPCHDNAQHEEEQDATGEEEGDLQERTPVRQDVLEALRGQVAVGVLRLTRPRPIGLSMRAPPSTEADGLVHLACLPDAWYV